MTTILVVEDSEALRNIIARALERAGYKVLAAGSGAQAKMLMDFSSSSIDLVVTDIHLLPGMSGADVALEMHARQPGLPVLYISGTYHEGGPVENFLAKPFSVDQLIQKVQQMLTSAKERKEAKE